MVTRFAGVSCWVLAVLLLLAAPSHQSQMCDDVQEACVQMQLLVPFDPKDPTCQSAQKNVSECVENGKAVCAGEPNIVQGLNDVLDNSMTTQCILPCVSCLEANPALTVVLKASEINSFLVCMKNNCTHDESEVTYDAVKNASDLFTQGFSTAPYFEVCTEPHDCRKAKLGNLTSESMAQNSILQNNLTHLPFLCKYIETAAYCFVNQSVICGFDDAFVQTMTTQYQKIQQTCAERAGGEITTSAAGATGSGDATTTAGQAGGSTTSTPAGDGTSQGDGNGAAHIVPSVLYLVAIILAMMS